MRPILVLLTLFACGEPDPSPLSEIVDVWVEEQGLEPEACGEVAACANGNDSLSRSAQACLERAWASCLPARASWTVATIEGDLIGIEVVVFEAADGCRAERFTDTRADMFGRQELRQDTCAVIDVTGTGCPPVSTSECD